MIKYYISHYWICRVDFENQTCDAVSLEGYKRIEKYSLPSTMSEPHCWESVYNETTELEFLKYYEL